MTFDISTIVAGGASGFLGWVGGAIQKSRGIETAYNQRIDKRLKDLEAEVAECRKRDGHLAVLTLGMKMVVPELLRVDKGNPVLRYVADAFADIPTEDGSFDDLLKKLHEIK